MQQETDRENNDKNLQQIAASPLENKMAQNPDPRANENIKATEFDKDESSVGSEITDGEAG